MSVGRSVSRTRTSCGSPALSRTVAALVLLHSSPTLQRRYSRWRINGVSDVLAFGVLDRFGNQSESINLKNIRKYSLAFPTVHRPARPCSDPLCHPSQTPCLRHERIFAKSRIHSRRRRSASRWEGIQFGPFAEPRRRCVVAAGSFLGSQYQDPLLCLHSSCQKKRL